MLPRFISPPSSLPAGSQVWAYLRDSGGEGQDRSVQRQRDEVRAYARQHHLSVVRWFVDEARSGGSVAGRDDFASMIDAISGGERPDGILLWNYARFARNLEEAAYYKAMIRKHGVIIHSLTDPIPEGIWERAIETLIDISNEEKRRQTSRDVKSELRKLVLEHGAMPGTPPRGFMREPLPPMPNPRTGKTRVLHRWTPDPGLVPVVQRAFEMRARGASLAEIQKQTRLYGSINSWRTFFSNPIYKGLLIYGDLRIPDYCTPVVTPELWEAANLVGRQRARPQAKSPHNPRRVNSSYILSGLVYCQECGAPVNGKGVKHWPYYTCSRRVRRRDCFARRMPARALEEGVITALLENVLTLENMIAMQTRMKTHYEKAQDVNKTERRALDRQLATVKKEITNLTRAIGERGHSKALLDALDQAEIRKTEIEIQLAALRESMKPLPEYTPLSMAELAEQLRADLTGDDEGVKRNLLRALITRIVAHRTDDKIEAVVYYIPPQNANTPGNARGGGQLGQRGSAPTGSATVDLIQVNIPVKKHKAPLRA